MKIKFKDINKEIIIRLISAFCMIGMMIVIFIFSSQVASESGAASNWFADFIHFPYRIDEFGNKDYILFGISVRKYAHMFLYFVLSITAYYSLKKNIYRPFIAFGISYVYACTDEFHQKFVEGRAGLLTDTLVDGAGALIGIALCLLITLICKKISEKHKKD